MNKFKIGDKVKLNKDITCFKYGIGCVSYEEVGTVVEIIYNGRYWKYFVDFSKFRGWQGIEKELVLAEITKEFSKDNLEVRVSCKT